MRALLSYLVRFHTFFLKLFFSTDIFPGMLNSLVQFAVNVGCKLLLPPAEYQQLQKDYAQRRYQTPLRDVAAAAGVQHAPVIKANNLLLDSNLNPDVTYEFTAAVKP